MSGLVRLKRLDLGTRRRGFGKASLVSFKVNPRLRLGLTLNATRLAFLEMAVYGNGSAAAGSNDDAPSSRAACPSCANTAAVGGFAQTDCLGCANCSTGVENEEDEEESAAPSRAPSKEELLDVDVHRNVVLFEGALGQRSQETGPGTESTIRLASTSSPPL